MGQGSPNGITFHKSIIFVNFHIRTAILDIIKVLFIHQEEQRLEAAQMKFLRHLLGITKLDKEKNQCIRQKTGAQNIVKE